MRKRLVWVDIAKGIAIILMIIGHEISGNIRTFIFSFICHCFLYCQDLHRVRY